MLGLQVTVRLRIVQYSTDLKTEGKFGENQLRCSSGKSRPTYRLLAGNDTVPTLVWRAEVCAVASAVWF